MKTAVKPTGGMHGTFLSRAASRRLYSDRVAGVDGHYDYCCCHPLPGLCPGAGEGSDGHLPLEPATDRSEIGRASVGKGCRSRWSSYQLKKSQFCRCVEWAGTVHQEHHSICLPE